MKNGGDGSPVEALESALLRSDRARAREILRGSCNPDDPYSCISTLIEPALRSIGEQWAEGDAALSQIYVSGKICEEYIRSLHVQASGIRQGQPRIGIAVIEDFHTLGKETVLAALRSSGYHVEDYGAGLTATEILELIRRDNIEVLFLSALMLRAALEVRHLADALHEEGIPVRLIVGGAPFLFDEQLWQEVGADAFAHDAAEAVDLVGGGEE
ncbi:MAG: cobalamin-binding protein [Methanocalculus sp. MSAO_Arc1]|uniref:cobalamin B12-binding domain-containing protein n=1 Tax=Methanocalculus TaxID=71151 RepID=UPI000FF52672|nr:MULTISPECIES: cobalamin-dependent protein [unclassified Methanocalculus]MCP1661543.1 methanogenic corrinoid protein MtbC1 [Methanocalculus sp. AMF5]RQD81884.1 MAG: cobalamin-binding protein [Methanocalculus sp. MSAO_Arc1]